MPPGPPVLETLVAEVYGPDYTGPDRTGAADQADLPDDAGVVDVDWYVEDPQAKYDLKVDLDKAALHGISAADVTRTMQIALGRRRGRPAALAAVARRRAHPGATRAAPSAPGIERSLAN